MESLLRWSIAGLVAMVNVWLSFQFIMAYQADMLDRAFFQFLLRAGIPVMVIGIFAVLALSLSDAPPRSWRTFWAVNAVLPLLFGVLTFVL